MKWRRGHYHSTVILLVPALITLALPCWAQEPEIPIREMRARLGGLTVAPGIEFSGGIDTNVFNVPEQPSRDFVWTVRPKAEAALTLGRAQLSGTGAADIVLPSAFTHSTRLRSFPPVFLFKM